MKISKVETFLVRWGDVARPVEADSGSATAVVAIHADGLVGLGEASPMQDGVASLAVIARDMAPALLWGRCARPRRHPRSPAAQADQARPRWDRDGSSCGDRYRPVGPEGKAFRQPIYKLLGGAWRTRIPFYASIGNNGARDVDGVVKAVEARLKAEQPSAIKIRWDGARGGDRSRHRRRHRQGQGRAPAGGRRLPVGVRRQQSLSIGAAIRVGRVLEDLGYLWFEEPVEYYHAKAMGEVAQRLDITVSAGEQSYTLQSVAALIEAASAWSSRTS